MHVQTLLHITESIGHRRPYSLCIYLRHLGESCTGTSFNLFVFTFLEMCILFTASIDGNEHAKSVVHTGF